MSKFKAAATTSLAALLVYGVASADEVRIHIDRDGWRPLERVGEADTDHDGYLSRAEATAQAERLFDARDDDKDGKIDAKPPARREGWDGPRREIRREVFIVRDDDGHEDHDDDRDGPPADIRIPRPPLPPIPMMLLLNSEEADLNGDGVLSKQEFVAQQLRFFDAADANKDGKLKLPSRPPRPPEPPEAPNAPKPPRR